MNICTPGNCICDAAEWAGDTNCMGEVEGVVETVDLSDWNLRYYFDRKLGVVISVQPHEMKRWRRYFYDPDLTQPV